MSESNASSNPEQRSVAGLVAAQLRVLSAELAAGRSAGVHAQGMGAASKAPSNAVLLKYFLPVIEWIGQYVQHPTFDVRKKILAQEWVSGQVWRLQGCSSGELLVWLDGLSRLIMQRMRQEVARSGETFALESGLEVLERLSDGLRTMTSAILGLSLAEEVDRQRELAQHAQQQSDSGLAFGHELRALLNSISLSAAVLENPDLCANGELRQQQVRVIRLALAHAESLLHDADLLKKTKDARGPRRTTDLESVLDSVGEELCARAEASGVELILPDPPPRLVVETVATQLALSNLVINAIKYADPAKRQRWVRIRARALPGADPTSVVIEVADNGVGIPSVLQGQVFQRNFRAHTHLAEGTGLGLSITREILADRGGRIDLTSEEGVGTTVRFTLPATLLESAPAEVSRRGLAESCSVHRSAGAER